MRWFLWISRLAGAFGRDEMIIVFLFHACWIFLMGCCGFRYRVRNVFGFHNMMHATSFQGLRLGFGDLALFFGARD